MKSSITAEIEDEQKHQAPRQTQIDCIIRCVYLCFSKHGKDVIKC